MPETNSDILQFHQPKTTAVYQNYNYISEQEISFDEFSEQMLNPDFAGLVYDRLSENKTTAPNLTTEKDQFVNNMHGELWAHSKEAKNNKYLSKKSAEEIATVRAEALEKFPVPEIRDEKPRIPSIGGIVEMGGYASAERGAVAVKRKEYEDVEISKILSQSKQTAYQDSAFQLAELTTQETTTSEFVSIADNLIGGSDESTRRDSDYMDEVWTTSDEAGYTYNVLTATSRAAITNSDKLEEEIGSQNIIDFKDSLEEMGRFNDMLIAAQDSNDETAFNNVKNSPEFKLIESKIIEYRADPRYQKYLEQVNLAYQSYARLEDVSNIDPDWFSDRQKKITEQQETDLRHKRLVSGEWTYKDVWYQDDLIGLAGAVTKAPLASLAYATSPILGDKITGTVLSALDIGYKQILLGGAKAGIDVTAGLQLGEALTTDSRGWAYELYRAFDNTLKEGELATLPTSAKRRIYENVAPVTLEGVNYEVVIDGGEVSGVYDEAGFEVTGNIANDVASKYNEDPIPTSTKVNGMSLYSNVIKMGTDLAVLMAGTKGLTGAIRGATKGLSWGAKGGGFAEVIAPRIGLFGALTGQIQNDYYQEAVAQGFSPRDAATFALTASTAVAAVNQFNPQFYLMGAGRKAVGMSVSKAWGAYTKGVSLQQAIAKGVGYMTWQGTREGLEEVAEIPAENFARSVVNFGLDPRNKLEVSNDYKDYAESFTLGAIVGFGSGSVGVKNRSRLQKEALYAMAQDPDAFKEMINNHMTEVNEWGGKTAKETTDHFSKVFADTHRMAMDLRLNEEQKIQLLDKLDQLYTIEKKFNEASKSGDKVMEGIYKKDLDAAFKEINEIQMGNTELLNDSSKKDFSKEPDLTEEDQKRSDELRAVVYEPKKIEIEGETYTLTEEKEDSYTLAYGDKKQMWVSKEDVEGRAYSESDLSGRITGTSEAIQEVMAKTPEGKAIEEERFERSKQVLSDKGVDVNYISNEEFVEKFGASGAGVNVDQEGKIYINKDRVRSNTAFHEAMHTVASIAAKSNPEVMKRFYNDLKSMEGFDHYQKIGERSAEVGAGTVEEESVVEFIADVAAGKVKLEIEGMGEALRDMYRHVMKDYDVDLDNITDQDLTSFAKSMTRVFRGTGEVVTTEQPDQPATELLENQDALDVLEAGGERLLLSDLKNVRLAETMLKENVSPEQIKAATGFSIKDGKLVSDLGEAKINIKGDYTSGKLGDILTYPSFVESFPYLASVGVKVAIDPSLRKSYSSSKKHKISVHAPNEVTAAAEVMMQARNMAQKGRGFTDRLFGKLQPSVQENNTFTKRELELKYKVVGEKVDGLKVREDIPNTASIESSFTDYTILDGIREVPMSEFDDTPVRDKASKELAKDIDESGEINPLIVAFDTEGAYILEGAHRFDAMKVRKAKSIPALVVMDNIKFQLAQEPYQPALTQEIDEITQAQQTQSKLISFQGLQDVADIAYTEGVGTSLRDDVWDEKIKEGLPDSELTNKYELQDIIMNKEFGMLTAENPNNTQQSDAANMKANEKAFKWLINRGYNPKTIFGKRDNSRIGLFVDGLTKEHAENFAIEFQQENVATDKGLVYPDGSFNPMRRGETGFYEADNLYSTFNIDGERENVNVAYDTDVRVYPTDPLYGQPAKANLEEVEDGYVFYEKDGVYFNTQTARSSPVVIPKTRVYPIDQDPNDTNFTGETPDADIVVDNDGEVVSSVEGLLGEGKFQPAFKGAVLTDVPIDKIDHGESALAGGKLTFPDARELIKEYTDRETDLPPIELIEPDEGDDRWMVYDGSHRLEAAKLRGDKTIKAYVSKKYAEKVDYKFQPSLGWRRNTSPDTDRMLADKVISMTEEGSKENNLAKDFVAGNVNEEDFYNGIQGISPSINEAAREVDDIDYSMNINSDMPLPDSEHDKLNLGVYEKLQSGIPSPIIINNNDIKAMNGSVEYKPAYFSDKPIQTLERFIIDNGGKHQVNVQDMAVEGEIELPNGDIVNINTVGELKDVKFQVAPVINTKAFKDWFGDSKVVDESGDPLVVYHGTDKRFTVFDTKSGAKRKTKQQLDFGSHFGEEDYAKTYSKKGDVFDVFLSIENPLNIADANEAMAYTSHKNFDKIQKLRKLLKIKSDGNMYYDEDGTKQSTIQNTYINQFLLDDKPPAKTKQAIIDAGFDGVIYEPYNAVGFVSYVKHPKSYIVFNPDQIKSATANVGTFDPQDPDIRFQPATKDGLIMTQSPDALLKNPATLDYTMAGINSLLNDGKITETDFYNEISKIEEIKSVVPKKGIEEWLRKQSPKTVGLVNDHLLNDFNEADFSNNKLSKREQKTIKGLLNLAVYNKQNLYESFANIEQFRVWKLSPLVDGKRTDKGHLSGGIKDGIEFSFDKAYNLNSITDPEKIKFQPASSKDEIRIKEIADQYTDLHPTLVAQILSEKSGVPYEEVLRIVTGAKAPDVGTQVEKESKFFKGTNEPKEMEERESQPLKNYFVRSQDLADADADLMIKNEGEEKVRSFVLNPPSWLLPDTRVFLFKRLKEKWKDDALKTEDKEGQNAIYDKINEMKGTLVEDFRKYGQGISAMQTLKEFTPESLAREVELNLRKSSKGKNPRTGKMLLPDEEIMTPEEKTELMRLVESQEKANTGLPKTKATQKLTNYVAKINFIHGATAGKFGTIIEAIWYSNILSGASTHNRNIFANFTQWVGEMHVQGIKSVAKGDLLMPLKLLGGSLSGFRKGLRAAVYTQRFGVRLDRADKTEMLPTLEWWRYDTGNKFVNKILDHSPWGAQILKHVGRLLSAGDALFYHANYEMRAVQMANKIAKDNRRNKPKNADYRTVNQILYNDKESIAQAKKDVLAEGFKRGKSMSRERIEYNIRVSERLDLQRGKQVREGSDDFAAKATFNYEPEGMLGGLYRTWMGAANNHRWLKLFVPFARIITNVSNRYLDWTPYGAYRAARGTTKIAKGVKRKLSADERADLAIKSMTGLTAVFMLAAAIDDEDGWLEITGNLTGDFNKDYQHQAAGMRKYSIRFKGTDKWYSYIDTPISFMLAGLGTISDAKKYGKEEDLDFYRMMEMAASGAVGVMTDQSWTMGLSDLFKAIDPSRMKQGDSKWFLKGKDKFMQTLQSVVISNAAVQANRMYLEYNDDAIKRAEGFDRFYRDVPVLQNSLGDIISAYGLPVVPNNSERILFPFHSPVDVDGVAKLFTQNGVYQSTLREFDVYDLEADESYTIQDDELYLWYEFRGKLIRKLVGEMREDIEDSDPEIRISMLESIKKAANDQSKAVFGLFGEERKELMEDLLKN